MAHEASTSFGQSQSSCPVPSSSSPPQLQSSTKASKPTYSHSPVVPGVPSLGLADSPISALSVSSTVQPILRQSRMNRCNRSYSSRVRAVPSRCVNRTFLRSQVSRAGSQINTSSCRPFRPSRSLIVSYPPPLGSLILSESLPNLSANDLSSVQTIGQATGTSTLSLIFVSVLTSPILLPL